MNPVILGMLKMVLPMMEQAGLQEWETIGVPALTGVAKSLAAGKGQEEALIIVDALDKIMKFESTRTVA